MKILLHMGRRSTLGENTVYNIYINSQKFELKRLTVCKGRSWVFFIKHYIRSK